MTQATTQRLWFEDYPAGAGAELMDENGRVGYVDHHELWNGRTTFDVYVGVYMPPDGTMLSDVYAHPEPTLDEAKAALLEVAQDDYQEDGDDDDC